MTHQPYPPPRTQPPAALRVALRLRRALAGLIASGLLAALVAGVPYGLWHWIGWPLPHHVPTWTQTGDTLTGPFTDGILLDTLACMCWILWAVFLTDTIRAVPDTLHARTAAAPPGGIHRSGPLRGLAMLLLATILAGLLSLRPHPALAARSAAPVATLRPDVVAAATLPMDRTSVPATAATIPSGARTAVVQSPHDGIHDSLWRIAERYLGNGARWPEIYQLNKGHPQPDGGTLSSPSPIQPGWTLRLPAHAGAGTAGASTPGNAPPTTNFPRTSTPPPGSSAPHLPPTPATHTGASSSPTASEPSATGPRSAPVNHPPPSGDHESGAFPHPDATAGQRDGSGGLDLGDGVFVSLGLAGAISAAVMTERRRRRRRYVPGSGRRDDLLPIAPVVRSLHLAHLRATGPAARSDIDDPDADEPGEGERNDCPGSNDQSRGAPGPDTDDPDGITPMMADAVRVPPADAASGSGGDLATAIAQAMALAVTGGLGLVGPGADSVLRGLVLEFLTSPTHSLAPAQMPSTVPPRVAADGADRLGGCEVVITAAAAHLVGHTTEVGGPTRLHIAPELDAALDQLEAITLHRARLHHDRADHDSTPPQQSPVLLITEVPPDIGRLQAVLDNSATLGVGGMLLGQWRPGASLYTTPDGHITSTSPGPARRLHRSRLPTLTVAAAHDLLSTLTPRDGPAASRAWGDPGHGGDEGDIVEATAGRPGMVDSHDRNGAATSTARSAALNSGLPIPASAATAPDSGGEGCVLLRVLGPVQLSWHIAADHNGQHTGRVAGADETVSLGPRQRELLLLLALHPDGIARDRLADTLWPDTPPERPFNALHTTLNRLRRNLIAAGGGATKITRTDGDRYQLDPQVVVTDYQQLRAALAVRRTTTDDEARARACRAVVVAYAGELGEGVAADWVETPREAVRRDVLDAAVTLARHAAATDPHEALDVLETARNLDPYNEQLYRDIMRLQQRLRRTSSIGHTLALLTSRLAEIDQAPEPSTVTLAQRLANPAPAADQSAPPRSDQGVSARHPVTE